MHGRRQERRSEDRAAAARLDHGHAAVPEDLVGHPDAGIEIDQVGAAAEEDMLAVVDHFASAWMEVGGGAAAQVAAALQDGDAKTGVGQGAGGCQPGHAASNYGDGVLVVGTLFFDGTQAEPGDGVCSLL